MKTYKLIIAAAIIGAFFGSSATFIFQRVIKPSKNDLIEQYYEVENAVLVSPHSLRKKIGEGEKTYVLVDLRSPQEYEKAHIVGAININAYSDPNTSAYKDEKRIVNAFRKLAKNKDIIVYCYSHPCMTGRKIGRLLAKNGIYVKHLEIGWNEWRYDWKMWNHDGEVQTKVEDYITSGKKPGVFRAKGFKTPCTEGGYGC